MVSVGLLRHFLRQEKRRKEKNVGAGGLKLLAHGKLKNSSPVAGRKVQSKLKVRVIATDKTREDDERDYGN